MRLCQLVALVGMKKTGAEKEFGELNKLAQKHDLFSGITRQYRPLQDGGEQLPNESKAFQSSAGALLARATSQMADVVDLVASQETANCTAKANIVVDGKVLLSNVPVGVMFYLQKHLTDIKTFVTNIPTLSSETNWIKSDYDPSVYVSEEVRTNRTKKEQRALVLYPATDKHPAQTQLITEDITVGTWVTKQFSTAISTAEKANLLFRIEKLLGAIIVAREEANTMEASEIKVSSQIYGFIFDDYVKSR